MYAIIEDIQKQLKELEHKVVILEHRVNVAEAKLQEITVGSRRKLGKVNYTPVEF